jgi:hypothetical protein
VKNTQVKTLFFRLLAFNFLMLSQKAKTHVFIVTVKQVLEKLIICMDGQKAKESFTKPAVRFLKGYKQTKMRLSTTLWP